MRPNYYYSILEDVERLPSHPMYVYGGSLSVECEDTNTICDTLDRMHRAPPPISLPTTCNVQRSCGPNSIDVKRTQTLDLHSALESHVLKMFSHFCFLVWFLCVCFFISLFDLHVLHVASQKCDPFWNDECESRESCVVFHRLY